LLACHGRGREERRNHYDNGDSFTREKPPTSTVRIAAPQQQQASSGGWNPNYEKPSNIPRDRIWHVHSDVMNPNYPMKKYDICELPYPKPEQHRSEKASIGRHRRVRA
jgi:hypothetical protein